jgi:pimeloyl-ACP methyl ester carboxylesterase
MLLRLLAWVIGVLAVVLVAVHACALGLEDRLLLHPRSCSEYTHFPARPSSRWRWLPSGGLVVTLDRTNSSSSGDDEAVGPSAGRELLFCHGNAGNLDDFENVAQRLANRGYRVRLLEYAGFGAARTPVGAGGGKFPSAASVLQDAAEAWSLCIREPHRAVLAGFSMGGGAVTQMLNRLPEDRFPGQVLLINTFFSLPQLVREKLPILKTLSNIMRTQWVAGPGLARYAEFVKHHHSRRRPGSWPRVVIVATDDDELMSEKHAVGLRCAAGADAALIRAPHGGHGYGPAIHWNLWSSYLAPP